MSRIDPLQYGKVYHIYNRGVNKMTIFRSSRNNEYFLKLYFERIGPVVDTYAWCLMGNHFHLMVRIKSLPEIFKELSSTMSPDKLQKFNPSRHFANFFIAYARSFNNEEKRKGALLERPFCRKEVDNLNYFKDLVVYIHRNPVKSGIVRHPRDYQWSSYNDFFTVNPTGLSKDYVLSWFDSTITFKSCHRKDQEINGLGDYLFHGEEVVNS
jgi:REP element-mobilizing transposase RayT